jgi:hypothetical protein
MTSEGGLDPFLHALPPAQHDAIFRNEIVPDVLDVAPPSASPSVLVLGGRAGSGKTFLKRGLLLVREDEARRAGRPPDRPVDLGTDELRDYHPDWRSLLRQDDVTAAFYTTYDCRLWVDEAIAYCMAPPRQTRGAAAPSRSSLTRSSTTRSAPVTCSAGSGRPDTSLSMSHSLPSRCP